MTLLHALQEKAKQGEKIAMLTCYDATFAKLLAHEHVDVLLVGDSLGMVIQGAENTLNVSMHDMVYHTTCVAAGAPDTLIIADMPLGSYEYDDAAAYNNAESLIQAGAHVVKIEGGGARARTAAYLVERGIPVCAHLGFTPQSVNQLGGYKIQGKTEESAQTILADARAMDAAGVSFIVLEMVPAQLAKQITNAVETLTIGIGAGVACDGQVLVLQDLLGLYTGVARQSPADFKSPRFVHNFLADTGSIQGAIRAYVQAVKAQTFPTPSHAY